MVPVFVLGVFMLIIYGAYTPHQKAGMQRVVCVKFKADATQADIDKHLREFAGLRREIPDIVGYSAGRVLDNEGTSGEFDVVHYITFRNEEGIASFTSHPKRQAFVASNKAHWENVLEVNSDIEK
ncbi:Dabb family protein [Telluribacter sp. SYSU D00476]|uniref:Dabb family protein n=1 Tax=Telluribacter sp. SYSU D00476 TaxID=2811430 RepID=UPI001FF4A8A1|nr:Dabb family protein [Telluribacter sp. SYSU D00476]